MLNTVAILVIFAATPLVFIMLYFITAPYGRHFRSGWGPSIASRASWFLMELPAMVVIAGVVLFDERRASPLALVLLGLWEMHYIYRTCLFPLLMKDTGKRFPVLLILFAGVFNSLNGYANGHFLTGFSLLPNSGIIPAARVGLGMALFVAGFVTHVRADAESARLAGERRRRLQDPPRGFVRIRRQPQLLRGDRRMDGMGACNVVPARPGFRPFHRGKPRAEGARQPCLVHGHFSGLSPRAQARDTFRILKT